jgi:GTP-binding protein Era
MSAAAGISRSGFVTLAGRPNVGKSTLLNAILGTKLAIVSPKPQTTRNRIAGVATAGDCQLVLIDTPGIHQARTALNRAMVETAYSCLLDGDVVCLIVDASLGCREKALGELDMMILERIREAAVPTVLAVNKVDLVRKELLLPLIDRFARAYEFAAIVPLSARDGSGVPTLVEEICKLVPPGERLYPEGTLTDRSRNFIMAEMVREQAFLLTREEIPYSVAIAIDLVEERPGPRPLLHVAATIHVERDSQKGILIGRRGQMLKTIGQEARKAIEAYLGKALFLELHVRVERDWTRSDKGLRKVGFEA